MNNFNLEFIVRDYECDLQKIVNNAVYFHYLEHTRHEFFKSAGISFLEMYQKGINAVVRRSEVDYKFPLTSGDKFYVTLEIKQESKITFTCYQDIYRIPDNKLIIKAKIICTCVSNSGKPFLADEIKKIIGNY